MKLWWTGVIDTFLIIVIVDLAATLVDALLSHVGLLFEKSGGYT